MVGPTEAGYKGYMKCEFYIAKTVYKYLPKKFGRYLFFTDTYYFVQNFEHLTRGDKMCPKNCAILLTHLLLLLLVFFLCKEVSRTVFFIQGEESLNIKKSHLQ